MAIKLRSRPSDNLHAGHDARHDESAPLSHIADRFIGVPLMIHPQKLEVIVQEVGPRIFPRNQLGALNVTVSELAAREVLAGMDFRANADRKSYGVTESGIAVIPVKGALMKRGNMNAVSSGKTYTYTEIGAQLEDALADPSVKAVLFDIDSPGGETHGAFELADQIYKARAQKPIYAAANDLAASAAYLIASACEKIFVTVTGAVGSIGVYSLHTDVSAMDAKLGVKFTYIFAGERKVDGNSHEPLSKSAKSEAQTEIDRQYGLFVSAVARNRGVSDEKVIDTKALCYFAENAVPLLADAVGTIDDAMVDLEARLENGNNANRGSGARADNQSLPVGGSGGIHIHLTAEHSATILDGRAIISGSDPSLGGTPDLAAIAATAGDQRQDLTGERKPMTNTKKAIAQQKAAAAKAEAARLEALAAAAPDEPLDDDDDTVDAGETAAANAAALAQANADVTAANERALAAKRKADALNAQLSGAQGKDNRPSATIVAELCHIAGMPEKCAAYIMALDAGETTVEKVRAEIAQLRADASHKNPLGNHHTGAMLGGALDKMTQSALAVVKSSNGAVNTSKAFEQVLLSNPEMYEQFVDEQCDAVSGGRAQARQYVASLQQRCKQLGLGTGLAA